MLKMKLERLVARYAPTPDKLSNVFERFLRFRDIKTEAKYRRVFNFHELVKSTGFQPVSLSLKRR